MGYGPIPWTAMLDYASHYDLDLDVTRLLCAIIREMDAAYLAWHAEDRKKTDES